nr:hypothetical protein CFP56_30186 [Quercus suber]
MNRRARVVAIPTCDQRCPVCFDRPNLCECQAHRDSTAGSWLRLRLPYHPMIGSHANGERVQSTQRVPHGTVVKRPTETELLRPRRVSFWGQAMGQYLCWLTYIEHSLLRPVPVRLVVDRADDRLSPEMLSSRHVFFLRIRHKRT